MNDTYPMPPGYEEYEYDPMLDPEEEVSVDKGFEENRRASQATTTDSP